MLERLLPTSPSTATADHIMRSVKSPPSLTIVYSKRIELQAGAVTLANVGVLLWNATPKHYSNRLIFILVLIIVFTIIILFHIHFSLFHEICIVLNMLCFNKKLIFTNIFILFLSYEIGFRILNFFHIFFLLLYNLFVFRFQFFFITFFCLFI